ncbi:DUF4209 domain-containing protein [[Clostridium] symbiosum]|uniref:DUF4209 domain-containing protein n=1 Tax=Clostridium symbiosum TaxID=1512 RepID=UPI00189F77AC|nr:DUF4209 domain-containing protein [[Clostridium] symbiosum]
MMVLVNEISKILTEKDYNIAARELEETTFLGCSGKENFFRDIILERWVNRPEDIPFSFARDMWKSSDSDEKKLLREILNYPIANINKAKINDFLWVVENDIEAAKQAEKFYRIHLESQIEFNYNFMAINRFISISKSINSKVTNDSIRSKFIIMVLSQYKNEDHSKILYLIQTAKKESVDVDYLLQYTEKILNTYDDKSYDYQIIGEFCDVLEELYCKKFKWNRAKKVSQPELVKIRKRKVMAIMMAEAYIHSQPRNFMRSIKFFKDAINILKTIEGTEDERKILFKRIDELEKNSASSIPRLTSQHDCSQIVNQLLEQLEIFDKEEILYFFSSIPLPKSKQIKQSVKSKTNNFLGFGGVFPIGILDKDGKSIAKSKPIKKPNDEIDSGAFQDALEHSTAEHMIYYSQIIIGNILNYIRSKFEIKEEDIQDIVENSAFVPKDRKEAYFKGLMAGFSGDLLTALYILIPQVENSIRELAVLCDEIVYNLNEDGIEELKTMNSVLELKGVKECLDEEFLVATKTVFCSKFGFNMRNDIAHGLIDDEQFDSYKALYTWWFIFKMCYMFCGQNRIDNQIKVDEKLGELYSSNKVDDTRTG